MGNIHSPFTLGTHPKNALWGLDLTSRETHWESSAQMWEGIGWTGEEFETGVQRRRNERHKCLKVFSGGHLDVDGFRAWEEPALLEVPALPHTEIPN